MIINRKYKYIFFHNPKCAGTYFSDFLEKNEKPENIVKLWRRPIYNKSPDLGHINLTNYKQYVDRQYWNYKKFCIIRNPYTRFLSSLSTAIERESTKQFMRENNITDDTFIQYLYENPAAVYNDNIVWLCPQYLYTHVNNKPKNGMKIVKFEDVPTEAKELCEKYGFVEQEPFDTKREANILEKILREMPEIIALVNRVYEKDFELLNFTKY